MGHWVLPEKKLNTSTNKTFFTIDPLTNLIFDDFEKRTGWEAKEFFNETENSWSLKNVSEAVKEGRKMCLGN